AALRRVTRPGQAPRGPPLPRPEGTTMRPSVTLRRAALAAALLLLGAAATRGQDKNQEKDKAGDKAAPANLTLELPAADARLEVDGEPTRQSGTTRRFVSPPLKPGTRFHYTFQIWFWE